MGATMGEAGSQGLWARGRDAVADRFLTPEAGPSGRRDVLVTLERFLLLLAVGLFASGLAAAVAAHLAVFRIVAPVILVAWLAAVLVAARFAWQRRLHLALAWPDWTALGIAAVVGLMAGVWHHDYVLATFDSAFYYEDAVIVAETGGRTLAAPFADLAPGYDGSGQGATARPGFVAGLPAFAALLAYLFGAQAAHWAMAPFLFVATLAVYRVGRKLGGAFGALVAIAFFATSQITIWLGRWLMTEGPVLAVLWCAVVLALPLVRRFDAWRAAGLAVTLAYAATVRPEAPLLLAWFPLVLVAARWRAVRAWTVRQWRRFRRPESRRAVAAALIATVAAGVALLGFTLRAVDPAFFEKLGTALGYLAQGRPIPDDFRVPVTGESPNWGDYALRYEWDSALQYALPWFLALGLVGFALRLYDRRRLGWVVLFTLPYLAMVLMPPVTTFHPWYMRRLWVAVIPLVFLTAGLTLDIGRLGLRFPMTTKRGKPRPRPSMAAAGVFVLPVMLVLNLLAAAPVAFENESDGSRHLSDQIAQITGDDAVVIAGLETTPYAGPLYFDHDEPVVFWFQRQPDSLLASLVAADRYNETYLLMGVASSEAQETRPYPALATDVHRLSTPLRLLERTNLLGYIARPPLERGYEPLEQYLDERVPADEIWAVDASFLLVRLEDPAVVTKAVTLDNTTWAVADDGLVARNGTGVVEIMPSRVGNATGQPVMYLVYAQTWTGDKPLKAVDTSGAVVPIDEPLTSDGSGRLRLAALALPEEPPVTEIHVPDGVPVRGAMVALEPWPAHYAERDYPAHWDGP